MHLSLFVPTLLLKVDYKTSCRTNSVLQKAMFGKNNQLCVVWGMLSFLSVEFLICLSDRLDRTGAIFTCKLFI